ncbi:class I SAM-dependent methyltransferase [Dyella humicola]|uniref:class I SAM-dependent methyltransferase n=1 Tax=Dyella humicola TaxID=2992126 RepID=UPI00225317CE|nr:class I SAM-dependent methyltransferase [Dyella humicola]
MDATAKISYPSTGHTSCLQVEDHSFWFKHRNECISALIGRFFASGRFVDVGGGNGFVARKLVDDGLDVILVEPGADGARHARELRGLENVIHGTLLDAMPLLGEAGAIGAFDVVEHVEDDAAFIDQVADALSERGLFFATVPAYQWLWSSADDEAGHYRRYTSRSFTDLLSTRFDMLFSSYFFAPLIPPVAISRALPYRLGRRGARDDESAAREHGTSNGMATRAMSAMLRHEVRRISTIKPLKFGSSLIVAARKKAI